MEPCAGDPIRVKLHHKLYTHISATEYRVVHLLPGRFNDELRCVLETRSFQIKTRYEALSYQWGEELHTKPIWIAQLSSPSLATSRTILEALGKSATRFGTKTSSLLRWTTERYFIPLRIISWLLGTVLLWHLYLPFERPDWVLSSVSRDIYFGFLSMISGMVAVDLTRKAFMLMAEVSETKPWLLIYNSSINRIERQGRTDSVNFGTMQVTANLELALRYFRREKGVRTLWIDALCINQANEEEKSVQIQSMDRIYANASAIVVWLGDYHGLGEADTCEVSSLLESVDCACQRQIHAAFDHIWAVSGWRLLCRRYFRRHEEKRFPESRSGLCKIARRGWWERLWVIQEVALATGRVYIQCGQYTCEFEEFATARHPLVLDHPEDGVLQQLFQPITLFLRTIQEFRYSSFHDQERDLNKNLSGFLLKITRILSPDSSDRVAHFQEQPFPQRLYRILLETSGLFKCRDDRDRLHAVLGIAGGVTTGKATQMASLVRTVSNLSTSMQITKQLDPMWETFSFSAKVIYISLTIMYTFWGIFYDHRAKYWTINRPEYVVSGFRNVIAKVTGEMGAQLRRVEFFAGLAVYLAKETKSLSFLDVATCGEDEDEAMPSWVPNWSRKISPPAKDFAKRVRKDHATDTFVFLDSGKTLQLVGELKGRVCLTQLTDSAHMQLWPFQSALLKILALPSEGRRAFMISLQVRSTYSNKLSSDVQSKQEKESVLYLNDLILNTCFELGLLRLLEGGQKIVLSYNAKGCEIGFLKAGEAARGDLIVFVPSCFHYLVLRQREQSADKPFRWKLVGLVATSAATPRTRGYSKTEWAQLSKDGVLRRYNIA